MIPDPSTNNGRVTLALLGLKLDYVIDKVDKIADKFNADHERLDKVVHVVGILKWAGGVVGAITLALLIAWAKQALGL